MLRRRDLARALVACGAAPAVATATSPVRAAAPEGLRFPADFGAHPRSRIEWWYATGALQAGARRFGFQITFFRTATGIAAASGSRFAATQLLFAHAAVTDLEQRRLRHDQRIARSGFGIASASTDDTALVLRDWRLQREAGAAGRYRARAASERAGFAFELTLTPTQPVLLQGLYGLSRKGPRSEQSSRYYSQPQLAVAGRLGLDRGTPFDVAGRAWLDHEWSDTLLDAGAVGWDWIGINLDDGAALMAFRIRRADGSTLWSGGSHRPAGGPARIFDDGEAVFAPGRVWASPATRARYPVEWEVATPVGRFVVKALLDAQELDSRASSGAVYWEGLAQLSDDRGAAVGRGYLEMTGYAAKLVL